MNDNDLMPFGAHQGKIMADVPASYFLYLHKQGSISHQGVREYIRDNMDVFQEEIKREKYSYQNQYSNGFDEN